MPKRQFVQEAASLPKVKSADGTYRVVAITEGEGSSGVYSAELIDKSAHVFEGVPSFLNHPIDPAKPHLRPVESIAGRFSNMVVEDGPHGRQIAGDFKPRKEYAEFIEEFQDIVGLSIYCSANGEELEDGRIAVESFDATDPYRSCDIVVAAGRGGRFKRAEESLRAIESSLGVPQGKKPGATAAPGEKERNMEIKELAERFDAFAKNLEPVIAFVAEQKAAADAAVAEAEAKAAAATEEKEAAIESYSAAVKAVSEAELLPSQKDSILAAAKAGSDVAPLIESAKKVVDEAKQAVSQSGYVIESASGKSDKKSFALKGGRH